MYLPHIKCFSYNLATWFYNLTLFYMGVLDPFFKFPIPTIKSATIIFEPWILLKKTRYTLQCQVKDIHYSAKPQADLLMLPFFPANFPLKQIPKFKTMVKQQCIKFVSFIFLLVKPKAKY